MSPGMQSLPIRNDKRGEAFDSSGMGVGIPSEIKNFSLVCFLRDNRLITGPCATVHATGCAAVCLRRSPNHF